MNKTPNTQVKGSLTQEFHQLSGLSHMFGHLRSAYFSNSSQANATTRQIAKAMGLEGFQDHKIDPTNTQKQKWTMLQTSKKA